MQKKALFHKRTESDGKKIFAFIGYSTDENGFFIEYGTRNGDDYNPETLSVQEFIERATSEESNAFYEFIEVMLSQ